MAFTQIESFSFFKKTSPEIAEPTETVNKTLEVQKLESLNETVFSPLNKIPEAPKKPVTASKLKIKTTTNLKPAQTEMFNGTQKIPFENRKVIYVDEDGNEMTICINCNENEDEDTKKNQTVSSITFKGFEVEWANDGSNTEDLDDLDDSLEDHKDTVEDVDDDSDEVIFFAHDTDDSEEARLRSKYNIQ